MHLNMCQGTCCCYVLGQPKLDEFMCMACGGRCAPSPTRRHVFDAMCALHAAIVPSVDKAPMGCACDAIKLMLSNIPVGISEATLLSTLNIFGPVVQLVLAQDSAGVSMMIVFYARLFCCLGAGGVPLLKLPCACRLLTSRLLCVDRVL